LFSQTPQTKEEWLRVAQQYDVKWNFPHCIGALDGKHIAIRPPPNSGSDFYNYKHGFSIVLMALVDADYRYIYVDIGTNGRISDGGVFEKCSLSKLLDGKQLQVPEDEPLNGRQKNMPYVIVADEAFPLKSYIMKPFSGRTTDGIEKRTFNYRLSRARRVVENSFGILANRFRVFLSPTPLRPKKVELLVLTCCVLHNFIFAKATTQNGHVPHDMFNDANEADSSTSGRWISLAKSNKHRAADYAQDIRNEFCHYFSN
jgi:hypothetical protein